MAAFVLAFIMLIAAPLLAQKPAIISYVNDVRFGAIDANQRLVIAFDRLPNSYNVFTLENPHRLVVDLPDTAWRAPDPLATRPPLTALRRGFVTPTQMRLVFESNGKLALTRHFILAADQKQNPRLVIDYTVGKTFNAAENRPNTQSQSANAPALPPAKLPSAKPSSSPSASSSPTSNSAASNLAADLTIPPPADSIHKPHPHKDKYTVIIDAGHGGRDPGAIASTGVFEKNIVFSVAQKLKRDLEKTGRYHVFMTRTGDYYIKLHERVKFSRDKKADLFISLHADSIHKPHIRGASFYSLSDKASDDLSARLADSENMAGVIAGVDIKSTVDEDVKDILIDLALREQTAESAFFKAALADRFAERKLRLLENPKRSAGFAVLKAPDIPSVLIELGFLSNTSDAKLLATNDFQTKASLAITDAVADYFRKIESVRY
jgi:N-acetylmuramoyl-L-alanine amidase